MTQILYNFGIRDEHILTAALLHDLVEDVPEYTISFIRSEFGEAVATIVELVTKDPKLDYSIPENIKQYLDRIAKHAGAALVKTADRMHNFGTLRAATLEKKKRTVIETETFYIPFFKECRREYPRYANFFFQAKTGIEPYLWLLKDTISDLEELEAYRKNKKS